LGNVSKFQKRGGEVGGVTLYKKGEKPEKGSNASTKKMGGEKKGAVKKREKGIRCVQETRKTRQKGGEVTIDQKGEKLVSGKGVASEELGVVSNGTSSFRAGENGGKNL